MQGRRAEWSLAAEPTSVAEARSRVAEQLADVPAEARQVVLVLTSELVTNAVHHGAGPVDVRLGWEEQAVRVEVVDRSRALPVVRSVGPDALRGRGLLLVDRLASAWGVDLVGEGKVVWFALEI